MFITEFIKIETSHISVSLHISSVGLITREHFDIYCRSQGYKIDLSKEDKKIISNIVERVYGYRCSIAHAKGDVEEYIAIPNISRKIIAAEIPLVKYLAYEVIKNCSEK